MIQGLVVGGPLVSNLYSFIATCKTPVAIDTETDGLRWWRDKVGVISFAWGPVDQTSHATREILPALDAIQHRMDNNLPVVFHNSGFDLHFLHHLGLRINWNAVDDTLIQARLINNLGDNQLKPLGKSELGIEPDKQDVVKKWLASNARKYKNEYNRKPNYLDVPDEILLPYASEDTRLTWLLYYALRPKVNGQLYAREINLRRLMFDAETRGVEVDVDLTEERLEWAKRERGILHSKLVSCHGNNLFNPDSNEQLADWLYGDLGLTPVSYTPTGQPQVDEFNLASNPHPATRLLQAYNKRSGAVKFLSAYLDLMDSRFFLHPTVNTMQARTHRFSCTSPNLQQIPARNDRFHIRDVFISGEGWFVGADFAKQELFIAACEGNERQLMADLVDPSKDVYIDLARVMLSKPIINSSERNAAKIAMLSMLYGAGAPKVAESFTVNTGRPYTVAQAKVIRQNVKTAYPGLAKLMNDKQREALTVGYVTNRWGRKLYVEKTRAYVATDYLVQSSGRDVLADALVNVDSLLPEVGGHLLWPIHDEVLNWLPEEPSPAFLKKLGQAMECHVFDLPLTAAPHFGKRLSDLK